MSNNLAYVAGLIDGDGSVGVACQKRGGQKDRRSYYASVTIGMTEPAKPILEWIHKEWGGSLHSHKTAGENECPSWQWRVTGDKAQAILRKLLPHLRLKGPQARLALEVERIRMSLPRTNNGGSDWTLQARAECETIKQKIHGLNAKGPGAKSAEDSFLPVRPMAEWNPQTQLWETDHMDLFSGRREPYSPTWPTSGMTRSGRLFPLPASAHPIDGNESSSLWLARREVVKARVKNGNGMGMPLSIAVQLLPTPQARDHKGTDSEADHNRRSPGIDAVSYHFPALLPTPEAKNSHAGPDYARMSGQAREMQSSWGKYAPAIARWEALTRPAPAPTEPNKNGNPRLSAAFSEWLMGWPAGWVTDPAIGISRNDQLRIVGNGVCPQQAVAALRFLLAVVTA